MDSKAPPQAYENTSKIGGRSTVHKGPIGGSTNYQWGRKENPTDGSFTLCQNDYGKKDFATFFLS
ncbi:hypothetical protein [Niallia sp. RD1]|uniref:hypothetical protein n=1 Tax=Niallia sp. RD1 TaxID=2962858 RepID=UPI0020C1B194|nr:hypothetical protein [Niallia sp. RD1]UTI43701.1 hypothetical protein NKG37_08525 [Niallia sp. RD1]